MEESSELVRAHIEIRDAHSQEENKASQSASQLVQICGSFPTEQRKKNVRSF